jgi:hypothetical protein
VALLPVTAGYWKGTLVAVKTMMFPAAMAGKEKREKMAMMETAISSMLSHPNIVQVGATNRLVVIAYPLSRDTIRGFVDDGILFLMTFSCGLFWLRMRSCRMAFAPSES